MAAPTNAERVSIPISATWLPAPAGWPEVRGARFWFGKTAFVDGAAAVSYTYKQAQVTFEVPLANDDLALGSEFWPGTT